MPKLKQQFVLLREANEEIDFIIVNGFKQSKHKHFPQNLLMRDVLIQEDRILIAIGK